MRMLAAALVVLAVPVLATGPAPVSEEVTLETGFVAATQVVQASKVREFYLESYGRRWRMFPDTNPPGSELTLNLKVGERARLRLVLLPFGGGSPQAGFDVDGIDAIVDGEESKGIHVWLDSAPEEVVVEFEATKAGLYPIYDDHSSRTGRLGLIIIRKR